MAFPKIRETLQGTAKSDGGEFGKPANLTTERVDALHLPGGRNAAILREDDAADRGKEKDEGGAELSKDGLDVGGTKVSSATRED